MDSHPRHRIVSAPTRSALAQRIRDLQREGWELIGEITLGKALDAHSAPYYCCAMREKSSHRTTNGADRD